MRKKPVELHVLQGTYRKDRHGNARIPVTIPKCPRGMAPSARKHWRRFAKLLDRAGIIGELDGLSLRLLAEAYDTYLMAGEKLATHGYLAKTANGNVIPSPYLAMRNRAFEQVAMLAGKLGLHPEARNGLHFEFNRGGVRPLDRYSPKDRFFNDLPYGVKPK